MPSGCGPGISSLPWAEGPARAGTREKPPPPSPCRQSLFQVLVPSACLCPWSLYPGPAPNNWYLSRIPVAHPCALSLVPGVRPSRCPWFRFLLPISAPYLCPLSLSPSRSPFPPRRCRSRVSPWAPARGSSSCRFSSSCPSSPPAAGRCQDEAEEAAARPGRSRLSARGVAVPARRRPRRRRPPSHGPAGPQRPDRRYRGGGGEACAAPGSPGSRAGRGARAAAWARSFGQGPGGPHGAGTCRDGAGSGPGSSAGKALGGGGRQRK